MTRFAYTATQSASQLPQIMMRTLAEVGVTSSTLYLCNGAQYLYTMGNTYSPIGGLGQIDPVQEENEPFPRTVRASLRAIGSADFYEPMREQMFGRDFVLRYVFLDTISYTPVSTPETLWRGKINKVSIQFNNQDKGTYVEIESDTDLRRAPPVNNYNNETMLVTNSGDTFFKFIDQVKNQTAHWGKDITRFNTVSNPYYTPPRYRPYNHP